MAEVKLTLEGASIKEIFDNFTSSLEEMGSLILKPEEDLPEEIAAFFRKKGMFLFARGEGIPEGLMSALIEEDQEEVVDAVVEQKELSQTLLDRIDDIARDQEVFLFKKGGALPDGFLEVLLEYDQEEVLEHILDNKESVARLLELLKEKGYEINSAEAPKDRWS